MRVLHVVVSNAVVVVAACLTAACTGAHGTEAPPPRPVRVQSLTVAATPGHVRYSATVEAAEQVPLAFKATGYVDDLLRRRAADGRLRAIQAGDLVQKGTVLARVRDTEYREQVNRGRARVVESEVGLEKARLDLERAKTLFAAESLIKPDLDTAQAAFDSGQARLAAARADAELAVTSMRDTALVAPTTGVLLERRVEVGSLVGAGTLGFVLGDISAVKARFGVPDSMVRTMVAGEQIDLVVEAVAGASFEGRITGIAPAADPQSRVFDIEVTIPNADGRLRPGMIGTVVVRTTGTWSEPATPLFTVPLTAIVRDAAGADSTASPQARPSAGAQADYALFVVERCADRSPHHRGRRVHRRGRPLRQVRRGAPRVPAHVHPGAPARIRVPSRLVAADHRSRSGADRSANNGSGRRQVQLSRPRRLHGSHLAHAQDPADGLESHAVRPARGAHLSRVLAGAADCLRRPGGCIKARAERSQHHPAGGNPGSRRQEPDHRSLRRVSR